MSHSYPSDISREQFVRILPTLESARRRTKPRTVDLYDVFCGVLYLPEKRVPVANAARGLPQLAYLLQVFPAMERAIWPGSGFHSGASPKKNRLARPDKAMDGKSRPASVSWTPRASRTRTPPGHKGYDAGKKVSGIKRHIAVDTQGLPMRYT